LIHFYKRYFHCNTNMGTIVEQDVFGATFDGKEVKRFTLTNASAGVSLQVISYGATITSLKLGEVDVVLGFEDMAGYTSVKAKNPYMGAVVGRVANRIAEGKFSLDGVEYNLAKNNGPNALHGGLVGLDKVVWGSQVQAEQGRVVFSHSSKDGDEGYPGDVLYNVSYSLSDEGAVKIEFSAMVGKATPINLANHVYFNLAGHDQGAQGLEDHVIRMAANEFTPVSDKLIPTGAIASVAGTVFDLRAPTRLGDVLPLCPGGANNGFDHNFVLSNTEGQLNFVCRVAHPPSKRWLECFTDQPGVQFYTGNFIPQDGSLVGKGGAGYRKHGGFCLETQKFPDSINQPAFPSCVVRPGTRYQHTVVYKVGQN